MLMCERISILMIAGIMMTMVHEMMMICVDSGGGKVNLNVAIDSRNGNCFIIIVQCDKYCPETQVYFGLQLGRWPILGTSPCRT